MLLILRNVIDKLKEGQSTIMVVTRGCSKKDRSEINERSRSRNATVNILRDNVYETNKTKCTSSITPVHQHTIPEELASMYIDYRGMNMLHT